MTEINLLTLLFSPQPLQSNTYILGRAYLGTEKKMKPTGNKQEMSMSCTCFGI